MQASHACGPGANPGGRRLHPLLQLLPADRGALPRKRTPRDRPRAGGQVAPGPTPSALLLPPPSPCLLPPLCRHCGHLGAERRQGSSRQPAPATIRKIPAPSAPAVSLCAGTAARVPPERPADAGKRLQDKGRCAWAPAGRTPSLGRALEAHARRFQSCLRECLKLQIESQVRMDGARRT